MDKKNFAFDKTNFILLAVGVAIVIIGFVLMSGAGSTENTFNPEIFSAMRIKVAPVVCFVGFISIIYAIIRKPKDENNAAE
jgi:membrane-bound ClpP family serine protease